MRLEQTLDWEVAFYIPPPPPRLLVLINDARKLAFYAPSNASWVLSKKCSNYAHFVKIMFLWFDKCFVFSCFYFLGRTGYNL